MMLRNMNIMQYTDGWKHWNGDIFKHITEKNDYDQIPKNRETMYSSSSFVLCIGVFK